VGELVAIPLPDGLSAEGVGEAWVSVLDATPSGETAKLGLMITAGWADSDSPDAPMAGVQSLGASATLGPRTWPFGWGCDVAGGLTSVPGADGFFGSAGAIHRRAVLVRSMVGTGTLIQHQILQVTEGGGSGSPYSPTDQPTWLRGNVEGSWTKVRGTHTPSGDAVLVVYVQHVSQSQSLAGAFDVAVRYRPLGQAGFPIYSP